MCKPRTVVCDDDGDDYFDTCYDPKHKADRGTCTVQKGAASRHGRLWLLTFVALAAVSFASFQLSMHHHQDKKEKHSALPQRSRLLRKATTTTPRFHSSPSVVAPPLVIQNLPESLAWKKARKKPRTSVIKVLPVEAGYFFNPSILELADGKHIFALRMGWLYRSGCEKYIAAAEASPSPELLVESTFHCLKHHKERFVDQTLLGEFDPLSHTLVVHDQGRAPSSLLPLSSIQDFAVDSWDAGAFWHDTRLLFPFNHRPMPGLDKILITSQNIEILGHDDWNALDCDSNLVLHLTYITAVDPSRILEPVSLNQHKMTQWLYYDAELERQEWDRRKQGESQWHLSPFDVARLKCHQRPSGLPALPFDPDEVTIMSSDIGQRKLNESWYFIKDKNWSPFAYEGKVLWSYKLEPHHVVCENDVDLNQDGAKDVDCVLCVTKYNSSSAGVFDGLYHGLRQQGYDDVVAHMNGAPAYHVPDKNLYLGLMHIIKVNHTSDEIGWENEPKRTSTTSTL
jgi:hypothetical protein